MTATSISPTISPIPSSTTTPTNSPTDPKKIEFPSPAGKDPTGRRFTDLNKATPDSRAAEIAYIVIGVVLVVFAILAAIALVMFSMGSGFILAGIIAPVVLNIGIHLTSVSTVLVAVTGFVLMTLGLTNDSPAPVAPTPEQIAAEAKQKAEQRAEETKISADKAKSSTINLISVSLTSIC